MGSFRSPAARSADQDILEASDRPEEVAPADWLAEGESIRYWTKLPHGAERRMAGAATVANVDRRGRLVSARFDVAAASLERLREGIVEMHIADESGQAVRWERAKADELLDGLPVPVLKVLGDLIDSARPRPLAEIDPATAKTNDSGELVGLTVGETSAES